MDWLIAMAVAYLLLGLAVIVAFGRAADKPAPTPVDASQQEEGAQL